MPFDRNNPLRFNCNVCRTSCPVEDRKHHCTECMGKLRFLRFDNPTQYILDFDLCTECVSLPPDKQNVDAQEFGNHKYEHHLLCQSFHFFDDHAERIVWEAKIALEALREALSARRRSSTLPATDDSVCGSCSGIISGDTRFYACLDRSCRGTF